MTAEVSMQQIADITGKTRSAISYMAKREGWPFHEVTTRGGKIKMFRIPDLPSTIQVAFIQGMDEVPADVMSGLCPEAALAAAEKSGELMPVLSGPANGRNGRTWEAERAVGMDVVRDERVKRIARIVQEALDVPKGWKKRAWVESVAERYGVGWQTIYKWIKKYHKSGLAGLQHTKSTRGTATAWDEEALDWWVGLNLKREHRKISKEELYYSALMPEAAQRGWNIGSYRSALWWLDKRLTPQLLALQRGGRRALDNVLPPILRDYSDYATIRYRGRGPTPVGFLVRGRRHGRSASAGRVFLARPPHPRDVRRGRGPQIRRPANRVGLPDRDTGFRSGADHLYRQRQAGIIPLHDGHFEGPSRPGHGSQG
jgi:transposase-like protein